MAIIVETILNGTHSTPSATPSANSAVIADGTGHVASGWGGVANSLATLGGSTKVPSAQMTGVLASTDLTNDAALEKTANKGAANGYASLDANTALTAAQTPAIVNQWTKVTKLFSDFSSVGMNTNDITIFTLPIKGAIQDVVIHHTTPFTGGTISAYTVSVGIMGTPAKYATAFNVFQAAGNTTFGFNSLPNMENFGATTAIVAEAISTGDTLDHATAGSVDIYILHSTLP
jgi:hypothetical protein